MKFTTSVVLTVAAAGSLAGAQPHKHNNVHHHHHHNHVKRAPNPATTEVVVVPGPTVYAYELDGKIIDPKEACAGIQDGSLKLSDPNIPQNACATASPTNTSPKAAQFYEKPNPTPAPTPSPTKEAANYNEEPKIELPPISIPSISVPVDTKYPTEPAKGGNGVDIDFPSGEIPCSEFPSDYGPISLDWLGLDGWSGLQFVTVQGQSVSDIRTGIKGDKCEDGAMCSYACPPGYQKSQWPSTQGATGQSVGGLRCSDGKLYLTNPTLSKKLCIKGAGGVQVKNTMDKVVAVCRTDYPGTESETIPLSSNPGSTLELTCPDAGSYYKWKGMDTSAQYYVNPKGVSIQEGCQWGDGSKPTGNWAPVNLGVGRKNGAVWISIFQNKPTTNKKLNFKVEIVGDNLGGKCKYENGMYHGATGSNEDGCTVQVMSGMATFVFSD
ncbi:SUN domain protein (Uth1) [Paracoccidioides lutzii Pb01]|uniref:SUN domain protein (Uth1) n=1 Tax=Paracoccidioides lutzii (strain ATCC MYA-826 / Pb01) TaxID=502779 RepID=C1GNT0_PARBA|nr:SUN domain protein (Uth1) [Paracoccidioides lutzii Pb01]EEH35852.1 SUN domain protein (Uth1) [Paracoccidioides lutzii Pb01]